jgi:hypothetical protein
MPRLGGSPERVGCERASHLHAGIATVLCMIGGCHATIANLIGPVEQPAGFAAGTAEANSSNALPHADLEPEELMRMLSTPQQLSRFFKKYGVYKKASGPKQYVATYRRSFADFQAADWHGDCNDFAEASCEVLTRHGYKMYLVSLWPRDESRLTNSWHQVAVCCVQGKFLIFDEMQLYMCDSLQHYMDGDYEVFQETPKDAKQQINTQLPEQKPIRQHWDLLSTGGVVQWCKTKENFLARFAQHSQDNAEIEESDVPVPPPGGIIMLAAS